MKRRIQIHADLVNRLRMAAINGSKVCADILKAYAKHPTTTSNTNYFTSVRVKTGMTQRIKLTMCNKDVKNRNFPEKGKPNVQWERTYRCECNITDILKAVRLNPDNYTSAEIQYAVSALCVTTKINLVLEQTQAGIQQAYDSAHYCSYKQNDTMPLHNSCMRHEYTAKIAGDFYKNVCGANILVAKGEDGSIYGRAIVWPKLHCRYTADYKTVELEMSLMDRIYYAYEFILTMMKEWAYQNVDAYKSYNDISHKRDITLTANDHMVSATLILKIPQIKWHKGGAPYVDTMSYIHYQENTTELYLINEEYYRNYYFLGSLMNTSGFAAISTFVCPSCGKITGFQRMCDDCRNEQTTEVEGFGHVLKQIRKYKGKLYPISFFEGGKLKETYNINDILNKLKHNA